MLRPLMMCVLSVGLLALGACTATADITHGDTEAHFKVDVDPKGKPADDDATSIGRGRVTIDKTGEEFEGEFYDTDHDGTPDKFKPDAGQKSRYSLGGKTDGENWHDVEVL
jgi:hypothetical protein